MALTCCMVALNLGLGFEMIDGAWSGQRRSLMPWQWRWVVAIRRPSTVVLAYNRVDNLLFVAPV